MCAGTEVGYHRGAWTHACRVLSVEECPDFWLPWQVFPPKRCCPISDGGVTAPPPVWGWRFSGARKRSMLVVAWESITVGGLRFMMFDEERSTCIKGTARNVCNVCNVRYRVIRISTGVEVAHLGLGCVAAGRRQRAGFGGNCRNRRNRRNRRPRDHVVTDVAVGKERDHDVQDVQERHRNHGLTGICLCSARASPTERKGTL